MIFFFLFLSSLLNGIWQILWKKWLSWGGQFEGIIPFVVWLIINPLFMTGFFLYGISLVIWIYILPKTELSYAYPFLAISFIIVLIGGYFLGEHINAYRIVGVFCIIIGILFISRS